ncbi:MAG: J domain-containing protein [Verrucomicrobiota bacterium]|jgi:TPR repeat protein
MTDEIREYYRLFELEPGAGADAVKQAYRELLKVWHPDRFPDAKFQKRATEKTKALNEAYQKITAYLSGTYAESRASAKARAATQDDLQAREAEDDAEEEVDLEDEEDFASILESARSGSPSDQVELADMYSEGTKVPKNEAEAFRWYLAAASQGDCQGMWMVGVSYLRGLGVERDKNEATKWLSRLAYPETTEDISGLSLMLNAQILMAEIYYDPGEPHDPATAYGWVLLAICYGQPSNVEVTQFNFDSPMFHLERQRASMLEQMKEKLESELTPEQRAKGQKMAAELFRSEDYLRARYKQMLKEWLKAQEDGPRSNL